MYPQKQNQQRDDQRKAAEVTIDQKGQEDQGHHDDLVSGNKNIFQEKTPMLFMIAIILGVSLDDLLHQFMTNRVFTGQMNELDLRDLA